MKFQFEGAERTALFQPPASPVGAHVQVGWGLIVRLVMREGDRVLGEIKTQISDPAQIKMFNDAPYGAEFEVTIAPVKDRGR